MTTDAAAWRSLREDWAELRTCWGALSVDERAASLASVEERLFGLEGAGGAVWGGVSSAAHARAVARHWHGRLERSARGQAADELAAVMLAEDRRWLARRRGAPRDDVEGAFAALLEVEEYALSIASGDGRRGEEHPLASDVAVTRGELRRRLGEDAAEGRMSEACRSRCAGRMVDHADDAVLLAGERSPEVCARRLELSLDAVQWHLEALEPDRGAARRAPALWCRRPRGRSSARRGRP